MRKWILISLTVTSFGLGSFPAVADVLFEIAVNVVNLDPEARTIGVECQTCTVECEHATAAQLVGRGNAQFSFRPGSPHIYNGKVNVAVKATRPADEALATDYLCTLQLANTANATNSTLLAGTSGGPAWTQPQPGTRFVNKLHGKLNRTASTVPHLMPPPAPAQTCHSPMVGTWPTCHCPTGLKGPTCSELDIR